MSRGFLACTCSKCMRLARGILTTSQITEETQSTASPQRCKDHKVIHFRFVALAIAEEDGQQVIKQTVSVQKQRHAPSPRALRQRHCRAHWTCLLHVTRLDKITGAPSSAHSTGRMHLAAAQAAQSGAATHAGRERKEQERTRKRDKAGKNFLWVHHAANVVYSTVGGGPLPI